MDVTYVKGLLESIKANAEHASKGLDGGDSFVGPLDALTAVIRTASEARVRITEGTSLAIIYRRWDEKNS